MAEFIFAATQLPRDRAGNADKSESLAVVTAVRGQA